MSHEVWTAVDGYIVDSLVAADPILEAALKASDAAGLPAINVAPNQGKLLQVLAQMIGAKAILEIGTLGGYSTIWLARGMAEGGRVTTLELDPKHAEVARANFARAGLGDAIDVIVGSAIESLPHLQGPYDLVFIDADKASSPDYFEWALKYSHSGTVIVVDNVVRNGEVVQAESGDANIQGVRRLFALLGSEPRVNATAIQTVGSKGYDGFAIAFVK